MALKTNLSWKNKKVETVNTEAVLTEFRKLPEFVELENFISKITSKDTPSEEKDKLIEKIMEADEYQKILTNPKLKNLDLSQTWLFPIELNTADNDDFGTYSLAVLSSKIDWTKVKMELVKDEWKNFIAISPIKLNIKSAQVDTTVVKIAIADDVKKKLELLIEGDMDFFTTNDVVLKNVLIMEYAELMEWTSVVDSLGVDEKGAPIVLNLKNFESFFSITTAKVEEDGAESALPYDIDENGKLEIFDNKYGRFDIDKVYSDKLEQTINPFLGDLVDAKININEIILGKETGNLKPNDLKVSSEEIIKTYKQIFNKFSDEIFFDHTAMTELEKAYTEFSLFLKQYNEKSTTYSGDDKDNYLAKLDEFMNKKSNILIDKISSLDSYLQEVSDEEKSALENAVWPNGELRKKIKWAPQNYLRTALFEQLLKFVLDCDKYRDTPILIGHAWIGKTFSSKVAASLLNKPLFQLTWHYDFSLSDLIGTIKQNNKGYFVLSKGPLVKLAEYGGTMILDEFNALPQEVMKALNGLLDEIKSGWNGIWNVQIQGQNLPIKVSPDLRIILTGNPSGYSAEYGNLAWVTTDLSRRTVVRELPPIELEIKKVNNKDMVKFPMIEAYFNTLDLSGNDYFKEKDIDTAKKYKAALKNKTTKFLQELLVSLGKGFIDKTSQVGLDAKNFYVLVTDPDKSMDTEQALKNVALSIPSIVINRLNEIIKFTDGNVDKDMMRYLETYIFEALRSDPKGEALIVRLTDSVRG